MKPIRILAADGTESVLDHYPSLTEMQSIVGGYIEFVGVLGDDGNRTSMIINEEGKLTGLPRNEKATEILQRAARRDFPDAENPFAAAKADLRAECEAAGIFFIDADGEAIPYIVGTAIYFDGWTDAELSRADAKAAL